MANLMKCGRSFLLWYAHDLVNFRIQELSAITSLFNIKYELLEEPSKSNPFFLINLKTPSDIKKIMSRTVLIKSAYEVWAYSKTHADLCAQLESLPKVFVSPYASENASFKMLVETFGKKISNEQKVKKINDLSCLRFLGPVKLRDPDNTFILLENYGMSRNNVPDDPYTYYFGRWLCDGQRHIGFKINLKTRKFIGNTSMDPILSLIMANLACIGPGDLVLDPFVGSGGLLVAAAHYGGYVLGTDIDYLMIHGKAKPSRCNQKKREPDENIRANLKQYDLENNYLDVLVADASLPVWRIPCMFDAIITDPPYGIRESTERIGTEKSYKIPDHLAADHIPSKVTYTLQDIIEDLLDFSSVYLKLHGRLVFWMPLHKEDFDANNLPHHPCLTLLSYCEQGLTNHSSRYLITMEKTSHNVDMKCKASVCESTSLFRSKYFQANKSKFLQNKVVKNSCTNDVNKAVL